MRDVPVQDDKDTKYRDFLDDLPEIVFELDPAGALTYVNRRVESVLGYSKEDLIGKNALVLITPETREALRDTISDYQYMTYWFGEVELLSSDGVKTLPARVSASPVIRDDELVAIRGVILDISMRKNLEEKLRRSEERFRRLSNTALEAILFHEDGRITDCNSAFTEMFGYTQKEITGKNILCLLPEEIHPQILSAIRQQSPGKIEARAFTKDGARIDIEFVAGSYRSNADSFGTVVIQDITHRKRYEFLQSHDELTGLVNYRGFVHRLDQEIENIQFRNRKIAVMTIRVNQDEINLHKSLEPDLERVILQTIPLEIADRLKGVFFNDDVISRTGDYEFLTLHLLPGEHDVRSSVKLINKALGVFAHDFVRGIHLSGSVGITFYPDDYSGKDSSRIVENSRYACGESRLKSREYMFYDENSHRETRESIEFIRDLLLAVRRDHCCDFVLHYQPKVNNHGRIVGMEALVRWKSPRWNNPETGFVMPDRFIRVAEETGLITDIGNWVLLEACRQTREWHDLDERFRNLQVAINVSPSQLTETFPSWLDEVLKRYDLEPLSVEIEITERESVKDHNLPILEEIRNRGISVAIDDFGIDYSALSRLPKLSIDTIKLDKSYIDEIARDPDYENLVYHTIRMVHDFDYNVVAEGVEDLEQVTKLFQDMGCDRIQGFYFYRPMPPDSFLQELRQNFKKGITAETDE